MGLFGLNIEKLKEKKNVEGLIKALNSRKDGKVRQAAAEALGEMGDTRAVEPLIEALGGEDEDVCRAATEALGKIGEPAVEPLIAALKQGLEKGKGGLRNAIAEALGKIGEPAVEPLIAALKQGLEKGKGGLRNAIAEALGKIGEPAVEPLIAVLRNENTDVRRTAAEALGELGDTRAVEILIEALRDEDIDVRRINAEALGKIGDQRAIKPLLEVLQDDAKLIRVDDSKISVTDSLSLLGWKPDMTKAGAWYCVVNKMWEEAIAYGNLAVEPLIATLHSRKWNNSERALAILLLGNIGDPRAVDPLILKFQACIQACIATQMVGIPTRFLTRIIEALGNIGDPRAVDRLIFELKDNFLIDKNIRISIIKALGNSGDPRALDPLSVAVNYFPDLASYEEREVVEKIIVEAQKRILHMGAPRVKIKQEIMRDLEQLESTDAGLRLALSPLKNCLKNNTIENYTNLALVTNQLADSLEATGTADDSIMHKLRQINEKLIKLSS